MNTCLNRMKRILEPSKELFVTMLLAILLAHFVITHHEVPTTSMVSTINVHDHVFSSRIPYYYRKPSYGEIVVFKRPNGKDWVKRVIGLPGDVIDIINGDVYRNGEKLDESSYVEAGMSSQPEDYVELEGEILSAQEFPYQVPEESYFLMGDNRERSGDCRYLGAINEKDIYGKVFFRIYPFDQIGLVH